MKCNLANNGQWGGRPQKAWSLIELIGVMAVLAVVTTLLVVSTVRHLDLVASQQETSRLRALADALQASILHNDYIPSYTNCASVIATQTGLNVNDVTSNPRGHARAFLIDTNGWFGTAAGSLPYSQTNAGTAQLPTNARLMLVSTMGQDLPVATGMPSASDFAALWNTPPNTVPGSGPWTTWNGRPDDVLIQRVNLSPLFVKLALSSYDSTTNGQYAVGGSVTNMVPTGNGFAAYFLKGTVLKLYTGPNATNTLDATQVLNQDCSFVFEAGLWRDSLVGRDPSSGLGDTSGLVAAFLSATPNTNAAHPITNAQQVLIVQSMINYLSNYNTWAAGNFTDNSLHTSLKNTLQPALMDAVMGIYSTYSHYNNYPTNGAPCP
ncbi:MAG TPA: hypothetical protein VIN67_04875 [Desulfobaccales bacterium]